METWAVVTTFHPPQDVLTNVAALSEQFARVLVVDDGSGPAAEGVLSRLADDGVLVERLAANSGIATALNRGVSLAFAGGASAVVTFDQDSTVPEGFLDALTRAHRDAEAAGVDVGVVVPEFFAAVRQAYRAEAGTLHARGVIQSGMLLTRAAFEALGGFDDALFIDLVDTEYELRCLATGRAVIAASGLRLGHGLGARYRRRGPALPGVPRVMTLSTPFRYFYRARNRVIISRRYVRHLPSRVLRDLAVDVAYFAVTVGLARPRRAVFSLIRAGFTAGIRGQGGRMPAELQSRAQSIEWAADRVD